MKDKDDLIKIKFSVVVMHPKGGNIVWTCGKDHIMGKTNFLQINKTTRILP